MKCSSSSTVRWCASGAVLLTALATGGAARAGGSAQNQAAAEVLFQQGKKLMAEGKFAEACQKLAGSQELDPAAGTLLNLGDCYEKNRQIASAWATFKEAATAAKAGGMPDREQVARQRAAALEPRLPHMVIVVPEQAAANVTEIKRDGVAVPRVAWGAPLPVDAGEHVIEAKGSGPQPWSQRVTVVEGKTETVTVTVSSAEAQTAPVAPVPPESADTAGKGKGQKVAGAIIAGAGVVALGIGTVVVLSAKSKYNGADCNESNVCVQAGYDDRQSAISMANTANIVLGAGMVALVAGGVLWLTAPSSAHAGISVQPTAGLGGGGLSVRGNW
jgi:hypothetical protein